MNNDYATSTRKIILTMLKTRGPLSVSEMAAELGITEMAVRRHLSNLERDQLITSEIVRKSMGRPSRIYSLSPSADALFPKNYHAFAMELLSQLEEEGGSERVAQLFAKRNENLRRRYETQMQGKHIEERICELTQIQNASGYMAEWEKDKQGNYIFKEYNCPISEVASVYKQICKCEISLFQSLLNTDVEMMECIVDGDHKCAYFIHGK
jgi:predicted ArsR family transcriptional regulator